MTAVTASLLIATQGPWVRVNIETFESRLHSETPLVRNTCRIVGVDPHANDFMSNRTFQLKMAAWPNPIRRIHFRVWRWCMSKNQGRQKSTKAESFIVTITFDPSTITIPESGEKWSGLTLKA